jgi:hypothetical protein
MKYVGIQKICEQKNTTSSKLFLFATLNLVIRPTPITSIQEIISKYILKIFIYYIISHHLYHNFTTSMSGFHFIIGFFQLIESENAIN